jgi:hypothetical protein
MPHEIVLPLILVYVVAIFFLRIKTHKRNVLGCHIHVHEEMFMIMHLEALCDGQI